MTIDELRKLYDAVISAGPLCAEEPPSRAEREFYAAMLQALPLLLDLWQEASCLRDTSEYEGSPFAAFVLAGPLDALTSHNPSRDF